MSEVQTAFMDLVRVGFHDPAGRKKPGTTLKFSAARAAWVTIGQDPIGRIFVLSARSGKYSATEMQDILFEECEKWQPLVYGVEANAMQAVYADLTQQRARVESRRLPLQEVWQPTNVDKDFRIRQVLKPVTAAGRLFLHPRQVELRQEIASFPSSPRKDLVDALASAIRLLPPPVSRAALDADMQDRLAWLRERGAPPQYIESVMRGGGVDGDGQWGRDRGGGR